MTRKLLSGVLAFAMVFGCTAPVALAEETVAEEVEQYALQIPAISAGDAVVTAGKDITLTFSGLNAADKNAITFSVSDDSIATLGEADYAKNQIKLTAGSVTEAKTVKVTVTVNKGEVASGDTYATTTASVDVKIVPVTDTTLTIDTYTMTAGKTLQTRKTVVGKTKKVEFVVGGKNAPAKVEVKPSTNSSSYISVTTEDKKDDNGKVVGTYVVLKGLAVADASKNITVKVIVTPAAGVDPMEFIIPVEVTAAEQAVTSLKINADKTSVIIKNDVTLAAQAFVEDAYGDDTEADDATIIWYVNGTEIKFEGNVYTAKNITGTKTLYTVTKGAKPGIVVFKPYEVGTYRVTATDEQGTYSASKTITATSDLKLVGNPYIYDEDVDEEVEYAQINEWVKAGDTVDLSGLKFAIGASAVSSPAPDDMKYYPVSDFGGVVSLEVVDVSTQAQDYGKAVAQKIATIKDGVVTIADETNEIMAELLKEAGDKNFFVTVKATVQFPDEAKPRDVSTQIYINITKPSDKVRSVELYADGKLVESDTIVMTVGKPVDFDIKVKDGHGFTDGIDQSAIWTIETLGTILGIGDNTVYATVDANGVVTPLVKCAGKAALRVIPMADTDESRTLRLYIMDDPTATVAPTEAPTAAPTAAPELKGTVNTSSSALNIRAAASTTAGVVTKAAKGSTVTILGEENGFYKVKLADGTIGYASKAYIKVVTDTPVVTITATTTANLKLRTSAPSGSVITVMPKGATVKVIEGGQSWAKVEYNGKVGYASNNYLTFNTVG